MASQQGFHRDLDHRFLQRAATFPAALKRSSNESHDYDSDELPYLMERLAVPAGRPVPHRILPVTARHSLEAAIGNVLAQTGMHSNVQLRRPSTDPSQSSSTSAHTHRRHRSHDQSTAYVSTYHYIPVVVPLFTDIRPVSSPYENNGTSSLGADGSSGPQRSLPGGVAQAPSIVASHQSSRRYTTQGHNSMPYPHANNAVTPRDQDLEPAHRLADYRCFHNHVFETSGSVASDLSEREYESHILGSDCDSTVSSE